MFDQRIDHLRRYADIVGDWRAFEEACRRPLPTVVWANPLRHAAAVCLNRHDALTVHGVDGDGPENAAAATGAMLEERLRRQGVATRPLAWLPGAMRLEELAKPGRTLEYLLGLYHVQEEASLIPVVALSPQPADRILDLCAAPGGKTAQLSVATNAEGTVVANDVKVDRLRALRSNCERLGLLNVAVTVHDGTCFPLEAGVFDRVLLDVPCSCEGNVRQGGGGFEIPDEFLRGRSGLQATLFGRAWKLLAAGGTLVYATCTFAPEENEMVLDHCLDADDRIEPIDIDGLATAAGVTEWKGARLRDDCVNVARIWPHLNDTGGFTVARVRKGSA